MGKLGLKLVFWKSISSHTHAFLFLIFNALRYVFKKSGYFSKKMFFQIFDWSNQIFDQSKSFWKILVSLCLVRMIEPVFQSIKHRELGFLKTHIWLVQTSFSKLFKTFFSLSNSARLHKEFFVIFLWISCKVSLSLSRYVHITLPFELFFSFSCIISWFLGKFLNYAQIGIFD